MTALAPRAVVGRRYRLDRRLTAGGMGVVWAATHIVTKREVAIKVLRRGGAADDASRARLLREARASCAIDHPSVVPVIDVIDADGAPALVMDLLRGESLRERLERKGALSLVETCAILAPVASALAAAHPARNIHRDDKPENVFLVGAAARDEIPAPTAVKILDFGVAKLVATEEPTTNLTESGAMLGTPYYMAPEQAFGERVGPAVDAWALGILLHECLSGARPTQADNLGQVIKRITQERIAPLEEIAPGVPDEIAALSARLLERAPTAREVDLASVAASLAAAATASSAVEATRDAAAARAPSDPSATEAPEPNGRTPAASRGARPRALRRAAARVVAGVVAAAALGVGLRRTESSRGDATAPTTSAPLAVLSAPN
ncbi:MAG: serine/threonine protein kinase, partial [Labilithrix sp.]|nr:serine/threonine protein kinase [Labilithrix sp.]